MGQQIQIALDNSDEVALIRFLKARFPIEVVNERYPVNWDRKTLRRTAAAMDWIILDTRTTDIILKSAFEFYDGKFDWTKMSSDGEVPGGKLAGWRIVSQARSCVEWTREFDDWPMRGRLYLNTDPDLIWEYVSARTGDDIQRMYDAACRWIKNNCVNCSTDKRGLWVSKSRVNAVRKEQLRAQAAARRRKKDPRDKRFYQLHRKKTSKLSAEEIQLYLSYCNKMIKYVNDEPAVDEWRQFKEELFERRKQLKDAASGRSAAAADSQQSHGNARVPRLGPGIHLFDPRAAGWQRPGADRAAAPSSAGYERRAA